MPCYCTVSSVHYQRYNIFEEAAAEVLLRMQETCGEAFQRSAALERLLNKAEKDEAEMEALRKVSESLSIAHSVLEAHPSRMSVRVTRNGIVLCVIN